MSGTRARRSPNPAAIVALATVLLAGCTVQLPEAYHPEEPGAPFTDPGGELWVARDHPCGFGPGGADEGCNTLTLLYRDGSVLRLTYGEGGPAQVEGVPQAEGNRSGLTFVEAGDADAFRDEVEAAWTAMHGAAPDRVRVHAAQAWRVAPDEREGVLRVVDRALDRAQALPEPTFDCTDCVAPSYWSWGQPQAFADEGFGHPSPRDEGWRLLEAQLQALHAWLDGDA